MSELPTTTAWQQIAEHPRCVHLIATALMGRTAECLRDHGITPTLDRRENARLHWNLHLDEK